MDLFNQLQSAMQGSQMGDAMSRGILPNGSQPTGSPQLYIKARDTLRAEVAKLNSIQSEMLRDAGTNEAMQRCLKDVMDCTRKLQGCVTLLDGEYRNLMSQQPQMPQQQPQPQQMQQGAPAY